MLTNPSVKHIGQLATILCCLLFTPRQAVAVPLSLGARLSIVSLVPAEGGATVVLAAPAAPAAHQPGLILGVSDSLRHWTASIEASYLAVSAGGATLTQSNVGLGLERTLSLGAQFDPYLAMRVSRLAESGSSGATAMIAAAVGVRRPTGTRTGAFRVELSYGRLPAADGISRPQLAIWAASIGFELWP